jgi:hypothetical protein
MVPGHGHLLDGASQIIFSLKPLAASKSFLYSSLQLLRLLIAGYAVPIEEPFGVDKGPTHQPGRALYVEGDSSCVAENWQAIDSHFVL